MSNEPPARDPESIAREAFAAPDGRRIARLRELCGADATLYREVSISYVARFLEIARVVPSPHAELLERYFHGDDSLKKLAERELQEFSRNSSAAFSVPTSDNEFLRPGESVDDRYKLVRSEGGGSYGVVWLAEDEKARGTTPRMVALKFIKLDPSRAEHHQEFISERRILRRLHHRNVVRYLSYGQDDRVGHFLVMEWVAGTRLDAYLETRKATVPERVAMLQLLCMAAHAIHMAGFVHGDIKPANILVQDDGTPKLLDLGLARRLQDDEWSPPATRRVVGGTNYYLAPEAGHVPTQATLDVYSLGITLAVLCGVPPENAHKPLVAGSLSPDLRERLEAIHAKTTAHNPHDRYESASMFAENLWSWLVDADPALRNSTPSDRIDPERRYRVEQARRDARRKMSLCVALTASVLLGGIALWKWQREREATEKHDLAQSEAIEKGAEARAAAALLSTVTASMDPYERMTRAGGPHATQYLRDLQHDLDQAKNLPIDYRRLVVSSIAATAFSIGDAQTSIARFTELVDIEKKINPAPHFELAFATMGKGQSEANLGHYEDAIASLASAVDLFANLRPMQAEQVSACIAALAQAQIEGGHWDDADDLLEQALRGDTFTSSRPLLLFQKARLLQRRGNDADAARLYQETIQQVVSQAANTDLRILKARFYASQSLAAVGMKEDAESESRAVAEAFEWTFGLLDEQSVRARMLHCQHLGALGKFDDALAGVNKVVDAIPLTSDSLASTLANALVTRALIHIRIGNITFPHPELATPEQANSPDRLAANQHYEKAVADSSRAVGLVERPGADNAKDTFDALSPLVLALRLLGRPADAAPFTDRAINAACIASDWKNPHVSGPPLPPPMVQTALMLKAQVQIELAKPGTLEAVTDAERAIELLGPMIPLLMDTPEHSTSEQTKSRMIIDVYRAALKRAGKTAELEEIKAWLKEHPLPSP